jgi:predicted transcriptional regulator
MASTTGATKSATTILREAERLTDPVRRLNRIAAARAVAETTSKAVHQATAAAIVAAREAGITWPAIGEALGVTPQRAQQLARAHTS